MAAGTVNIRMGLAERNHGGRATRPTGGLIAVCAVRRRQTARSCKEMCCGLEDR